MTHRFICIYGHIYLLKFSLRGDSINILSTQIIDGEVENTIIVRHLGAAAL